MSSDDIIDHVLEAQKELQSYDGKIIFLTAQLDRKVRLILKAQEESERMRKEMEEKDAVIHQLQKSVEELKTMSKVDHGTIHLLQYQLKKTHTVENKPPVMTDKSSIAHSCNSGPFLSHWERSQAYREDISLDIGLKDHSQISRNSKDTLKSVSQIDKQGDSLMTSYDHCEVTASSTLKDSRLDISSTSSSATSLTGSSTYIQNSLSSSSASDYLPKNISEKILGM